MTMGTGIFQPEVKKDEPATLEQVANALGVEKTIARAALDLLVASHQTEDRGIEVRKVAGGWKFYTKPQHHDVVRKFIKSLQPPLRRAGNQRDSRRQCRRRDQDSA